MSGLTNPLDLPGPQFLGFYFVVIVIGLLLGLLVRRWVAAIGAPPPAHPFHLDAYEAAYVRGGAAFATDTAVAMLVQRHALTVSAAARTLSVSGPLPPGAHVMEQAVYGAIGRGSKPIAEVRSDTQIDSQPIAERLKATGLVLSDDRWATVRTVSAAIMAAVLILGVLKILVGISRNRPVGFLVVLVIATGIICLTFWFKRPLATPFGKRALRQLKDSNAALETTAKSQPQMLAAGDIAFAIGLFGVASVGFADSAWSELKTTLGPPPSSSGGGCGSSSCSSGCGGGGGCGGCGGG